MNNKCRTCGDKVGYFSPNREYCSVACEQNVERKKPSFEDLFSSLIDKHR